MGISGSKSQDDGENTKFSKKDISPNEQPRLFGNLPKPYPIDSIEPTLLLFNKDGYYIEIDHLHHYDYVMDVIRLSNWFDNNQRFVIITHGFRSNRFTEWMHICKDSILDKYGDTQIVGIFGWGGGANLGLLNYQQAAANSIAAGKWLGYFMAKFRKKFPNVAIYGIGHSLGAHLLGIAGRINRGSFERITGLDPAGPGFQKENQEKRLNREDAKMVDVIHTDGLDVPYFGTLIPLGKIDFYPNYGWNQPSSEEQSDSKPQLVRNSINQQKLRELSALYGYDVSESHGRAIDLFIWSIQNPKRFCTHYQLEQSPKMEKAVHRIRSTSDLGIEVEMGYHLDMFISSHQQEKLSKCNQIESMIDDDSEIYWGNYYVHTNSQPPWC